MFLCKLSVIVVLLINLQQTWTQHRPGPMSKDALALQTMLQSAVKQNRHLQAQNARLKVIWAGLENMCKSITPSVKCDCEVPAANRTLEPKHPPNSKNLAAGKIRDTPPPSVEFYRHDNGRIINSAKFKDIKWKQTKSPTSSGHVKYTMSPSPIADVLKDLNIAPFTAKPAVSKTTTTPPQTGYSHTNDGMDLMHEMLGSHTHKDTNRGQPKGTGVNSIMNLSIKPFTGPGNKGHGHGHGNAAAASLGHRSHTPYTTHVDSAAAIAGHQHHLAEFDFINEVNGKSMASSHGHHSNQRVQNKQMDHKPPVDKEATNVRAFDLINTPAKKTTNNVRASDPVNNPMENKATNVRSFEPINNQTDTKANNVQALNLINKPVDNKATNVRSFDRVNSPANNKAANVSLHRVKPQVDNKATKMWSFNRVNSPTDTKANNVRSFNRVNSPVDNKATIGREFSPVNTPFDNKATNVRAFNRIKTPVATTTMPIDLTNNQPDKKATNVRAFNLINTPVKNKATNVRSFDLFNSPVDKKATNVRSFDLINSPVDKKATNVRSFDLINSPVDKKATNVRVFDRFNSPVNNKAKNTQALNGVNSPVNNKATNTPALNRGNSQMDNVNTPVDKKPTNGRVFNRANSQVNNKASNVLSFNNANTPVVKKPTHGREFNRVNSQVDNKANNVRSSDRFTSPVVNKVNNNKATKRVNTPVDKNTTNERPYDLINTPVDNKATSVRAFDLINRVNGHLLTDKKTPLSNSHTKHNVKDHGSIPMHNRKHGDKKPVAPNNNNKLILNDLLLATEQSIQKKQKAGQKNHPKHMGQQNHHKHMPKTTSNMNQNAPGQPKPNKPMNAIKPQFKSQPKGQRTTMTTQTTTATPNVAKFVKLAIKAVSSEGLVTNTIAVTVRYSAPVDHTTEWLQLQSNGATTRTSGVRVVNTGPDTEYSSNMVFVDANATRHALFRLFGNNKSISIQFNLAELHLSGEQLLPNFEDDIINFDDTLQAQRDRDLVIDLEVRGSPSENPALRHTEIFFTGLNTTTRPQTVFEIVHFNSEGVSVELQPRTRFTSTMRITLKRPYIDFGGILTVRLPQTVGGYLAGYYYGHLIRVLEFYTQEVIPFGNLGVYYLPKRTLVRDPSQSILCAAMGNPPPDVVILKVAPDGTEKATLTETIMLDTVTNMKSLTLYADKPNASEGKYICRASIGSEVVDSTTEVVIVQPPEFDTLHTGVTSKSRNRVTISCKASGKPRPKLEMRLYEKHGPNIAKNGLYKTSLLTPNNYTSQLALEVSSNDREIHTVVCVAKQDIPDAKEHYKNIIVFPNSDDYTNWYLYNRLQSMATGW